MGNKAVFVIHPFQQHSFKTAEALKECGILRRYITTAYNKKGSWTNRYQWLLSKENQARSEKRKSIVLQDDEVLQFCEVRSLFLLLLQRVDKSRRIYNWYFQRIIKLFNTKVFRIIEKERPDAIIVYDTLCADLIKRIKENNLDIKVIVDMSAPYYNYMEKEFIKDSKRYPQYSKDMLNMLESSIYSYRRAYSEIEISLADAFLVASKFTEKSLKESGVKSPIYQCQYGIDDFINLDRNSQINKHNTRLPLKVIYVGRVNQAKGAYLLIDVANYFNSKEVTFDFFGSYDETTDVVKNAPLNCVFHGHVPRQTMHKAYTNADLLILPTLADGFGFVIPEALSYGLPVVCSRNAGASQFIKEGENGFVYDVGNKEYLVELLKNVVIKPNLLDQMRATAVDSVNNLTWSNYNQQVRTAINDIFQIS